MQESRENIPFLQENGNYTSAPVPAGNRPSTYHLPPLAPIYFSLDLKGKVFWQSMDPFGCQFFHQKLQARKPEDIQMIFSEVKDTICMLMFDRLGSYVIQKLFEVCNEEQMTQLVSSVTADVGFLKAVCCNSQGSKSMMKFLRCLMTPKQISDMMFAFQQVTVPLATHLFGSDVIGHCFDIFPIPAEETKPILDVIADNCLKIATNFSGSSLLMMQILIPEVFLLESQPRILTAITENAYQLSQDRFGHQVLQDVIVHGKQDVVRDLMAKLRKDFAALSMDNFAHDVVRVLMEKDREEYTPQIISDIIKSPNFKIVQLHPYGKLVLQCAEKYSGTVSETLKICLLSDNLQSHHDGKNVLPKKKKNKRKKKRSHV